jgi:ribosomal protein S8
MVQNSYSQFLNQLKITASQKKLFFEIRLTTKTKALANLLVRMNVVRRFHRVSATSHRVFPAYTRHRKYLRRIQTYTRANSRHRFRLSTIRTLHNSTPNSYYILETDKGLMTHKDALRNQIGGLLLVVIC